jgi:hypothetical protein
MFDKVLPLCPRKYADIEDVLTHRDADDGGAQKGIAETLPTHRGDQTHEPTKES